MTSSVIVNTLEKQFSVVREVPEDTVLILVLGSGHNPQGARPPNSVLDVNSLSRLLEAIRLWKLQPDALLVTTAGLIRQGQSHAESMAVMASALGVPQSKIRQLDTARDTEDELTQAVTLLGEIETTERLLVVSSAIHLPRAEMLLQPMDVPYTLAPTDFLATPGHWYRFNAQYLSHTERVIHEYAGMLWLKIRHWFS